MTAAFEVSIENTGERYLCAGAQTLLSGMEMLGRGGIPVGCRGGGCGVCKIQITEGSYATEKMSRAHVSAEEEERGIALACRARPRSNISLRVVGKMIKAVGRGAPASGGTVTQAWLAAARTAAGADPKSSAAGAAQESEPSQAAANVVSSTAATT
jgi:ferredoxin